MQIVTYVDMRCDYDFGFLGTIYYGNSCTTKYGIFGPGMTTANCGRINTFVQQDEIRIITANGRQSKEAEGSAFLEQKKNLYTEIAL